MLCQKKLLKTTVHGAAFTSVLVNNKVELAVKDIDNKVFWKAIYILLRAVFHALKMLRYCDSNIPAMDKIFHLIKRG